MLKYDFAEINIRYRMAIITGFLPRDLDLNFQSKKLKILFSSTKMPGLTFIQADIRYAMVLWRL